MLQSDGASVVLTTSTLGSNSFTLTASNIVTLAGVNLPPLTSTATGTATGWTVQFYQSTAAFQNSNGTLSNLAQAQTLVDTPADQLSAQTFTPQVINFGTGQGGSGSGNFTPDLLLPGQTAASENIYDYALVANGSVYIPAAGDYTFDCNSDDGFQLTISGANFLTATNATDFNGNEMQYDSGRAPPIRSASLHFRLPATIRSICCSFREADPRAAKSRLPAAPTPVSSAAHSNWLATPRTAGSPWAEHTWRPHSASLSPARTRTTCRLR